MAVARIKQNLWRESYIGFVATAGDPLGRSGSWLSGVDFTYSTSSFLGNKNFSVNAWAVATGREGLGGDRTAYAVKIDYPNDKWDMRFWYRRIGRDFDPSLGFVPRRAMQRWNPAISNRTRFARGPIQDMSIGVNPYITTDLARPVGEPRRPYHVVNWRFRSGDRVQVIVTPAGDRPAAAVRNLAGVIIAPGRYTGCGGTSASPPRRSVASTRLRTGRPGSFYDGDLTQWDLDVVWNPTPLFTVEFTAERNDGDLPAGGSRRTWSAHGCASMCRRICRLRATPSTTPRATRWASTRGCAGRFFPWPICSSSTTTTSDRCSIGGQLESNQLLVKLQYAWRM